MSTPMSTMEIDGHRQPHAALRVRVRGSRGLLALLALCMFVPAGHADTAVDSGRASPEQERANLWELVIDVQSRTVMDTTPAHAALAHPTAAECAGAAPGQQLAEAHRAEAERWRGDLGFEFRGGYETEPNADATTDGSDTNGYLELSWEVLRGGYLDNRDKAQAATTRARLAELNADRQRRWRNGLCTQQALEGRFAPLRSRLLTLEHELMTAAHRIEQRAYFNGWSHLDELLVSESDLRMLQHRLSRVHGNPALRERALSGRLFNPPPVDVDMAAVAARIESSPQRRRVAELERKLSRLDHEERFNRLRFFLRQGVGDNEAEEDLSAGVRWSIPLGSMRADQNAVLESRRAVIDAERSNDAWARATRAKSEHLELQDRLGRVIERHYRHARARERLRRSVAEYRVTPREADVGLAVSRARDVLQSARALADAKENLYRQVIELFTVAGVEPTPALLEPVHLPGADDRRRIGDRALYLWSEAFERLSDAALFAFIEAKGIDALLLSPGHDADGRLPDFLRRADELGIRVEIVKGDPRWVLPGHRDNAIAEVRRAGDLTGAVHLDVEPQALDEFGQRPQELLSSYLELLREIRAAIDPDIRLSVALPLHWPPAVYRAVAADVDAIHLMAYGHPRPAKLLEWLTPALSVLPAERVRVVLRPEDFDDEWTLEQTLTTVARETGIERYAIHDITAYMDFSADTP